MEWPNRRLDNMAALAWHCALFHFHTSLVLNLQLNRRTVLLKPWTNQVELVPCKIFA